MESIKEFLPLMRCPYSGFPLSLGLDGLRAAEKTYRSLEGMPNLVQEEEVAALDELFQRQYGEKTARIYDRTLKLQSLLFGCWEPAQRKKLVRLLNPPVGGLILEVAVGTGANLPFLTKAVGTRGRVVGVDLSLSMLKAAQIRVREKSLPVYLMRADGNYLPFADNSFDAVFHFGGINMFADIRKAVAEMLRVAKPAAPIVISDEGMSEKRRCTWIGRRLGKMNSLNLCRAPFSAIPWAEISQFELHWAWRELFYVFYFQKRAKVGDTSDHNDIYKEVDRRIGMEVGRSRRRK